MRGIKTMSGTALGALVALLVVLMGAGDADANPRTKKKIRQKVVEAMEYYDLLEYEEARKGLNQALAMAKKSGLESDRVAAEVYLRLGIVYFAGFEDVESAKLNFIEAVQIDPSIEIDPAYRTGEMDAVLGRARSEFGGGKGGAPEPARPSVDCGTLNGIAHTLVDSAEAGSDRSVGAHVAPNLGAAKVALFYRPQGAADFVEVAMSKRGDCEYMASIPGDAIAGDFLHYYVSAVNDKGKTIAAKGSAGSPNIIEVAMAGGAGGGVLPDDEENPLGAGGREDRDDGDDDSGPSGPSSARFFVSVAAGTGGGLISGETEQRASEVSAGFAPALLHVFPEVGYYLSPRTSISLAGRIGLVIGANLPGHATAAPAGLVRLRHALSESGTGLQVSGAIGGGILRNTVELVDEPEGMNVDTTAGGPLLIGGGVGYTAPLGGPVLLAAEVNTLAGIPIIDQLGTCPGAGCVKPNFVVQVDFNLGLLLAF